MKETLDNVLDRVEELETKISFQEHTLDELNKMVVLLQQENSKLAEQLRLLSEKLSTAQLSHIANQSEETPPPHY